MELKPIKEKKRPLYPTIQEVPKSNFMKEILLAVTITSSMREMPVLCVAVPCYVATSSYMVPIGICELIRNISILMAILSSILLIVNKVKISKCISENISTEQLKKHGNVKWWIWGISIAIIAITSLAIICLENNM